MMQLDLRPAAFCLLFLISAGPAEKVPPAVDFDGLKAALATVPAGVLPAEAKDWTVAKADVANDVFTHQVMHKMIRVQLKVMRVRRAEGEGGGYIIECAGSGPDDLPQKLDVTFFVPVEKCLVAARLNVGEQLTVSGEVDRVLFDVSGNEHDYDCTLQLNLDQFTIESPVIGDSAK